MAINSDLQNIISSLPKECGVYIIYNLDNEIIYIGKSINIRNRIIQHFASTEIRELKLKNATHRIDYELTGSELIALLRESELIKTHLPIFNRAQRRNRYFYALYDEYTKEGYHALIVSKIQPGREELTTFGSSLEAKNTLYSITEKYTLCQKINGLYPSKAQCFQYTIKQCNGACINAEAVEVYNERVQNFLEKIKLPKGEILIEVEGRNDNEKGIVFIKNGMYKGFGYAPQKLRSLNSLIKYIDEKDDNRDVRRIIMRHLRSQF